VVLLWIDNTGMIAMLWLNGEACGGSWARGCETAPHALYASRSPPERMREKVLRTDDALLSNHTNPGPQQKPLSLYTQTFVLLVSSPALLAFPVDKLIEIRSLA